MLQNNMERLLVSSEPKADESLIGYVLRLTERNGYETPLWILEMVSPNYKDPHRAYALAFGPQEDVDKLARVIGIGRAKLACLTYPRVNHSDGVALHSYQGQAIPQHTIRQGYPKICPDCLSEASYCRRIWELSFITICLKHERLLIDECPSCNKRISLFRKHVGTCSCQFHWRDSPALPVKEPELRLAKYVYQLCGLLADENDSQELFPALQKLTLNDLLLALFFIAGQHRGISSATSKHLVSIGRNKDFHGTLIKAHTVFENWPNNYFRFLDERRIQERKATGNYPRMKSALYGEFGSFYSGLHGVLSGSQFDFMRGAFIDYITQKRIGDRRSSLRPQKLIRDSPDGPYVLKSDVRRLLGVDYGWINHRIRAGEVKFLVRNKGKKRLIFVDLINITKLKLAQNPC
jgi:hypothetical protein